MDTKQKQNKPFTPLEQGPENEGFVSGDNSVDDRVHRRLHTATLYWGFFVFGWVVGQRGASFLDLLLVTHTDVTVGSLLLTIAALANVLGALAGGFLLDAFQKPIVMLASAMLLNSLVSGTVPLCTAFPVMSALYFLTHMAFAVADVVSNSEVAKFGPDSGRAAMQGLHFCFSVGAILSPLATQPFLAENSNVLGLNISKSHNICRNCSEAVQEAEMHRFGSLQSLHSLVGSSTFELPSNFTSATPVTDHSISTEWISDSSQGADFSNESRVIYAFLITSILCFTALILFTLLLFLQYSKALRVQTRKIHSDNTTGKEEKTLVYIAVMLVCVYTAFSSFISFPDFLMIFVVRALNWSKTSGAHVTSVYWVGLAVGRVSGVMLVRVMSSARILAACLLSLMVSLTALLLASLFRQDWAVWASTAAVGLSVAVLFPTALSYTYERVCALTGRVAALIFTTPMVAAMLNPLLLAHVMTLYDDMYYVYVFLGEAVVAVGTFALLHVVCDHLARLRVRTRGTELCQQDVAKDGLENLFHEQQA